MEHESCESATGPVLSHMPLWIRQPLMFKTRSVEYMLFVLSLLTKLFIKYYHVQWLYLFIYCLFNDANIGSDLLR